MKKIIIAIDGYAACGKSTLARQLAGKLNYLFLDTGAMYRAVTLYFLDNNINWKNEDGLNEALSSIHIQFNQNNNDNLSLNQAKYQTYLNGKDVEEQIRSVRVSEKVSEVAAVTAVRKFLVKQQQEIGSEKAIVLDGRDIGTVVFPFAELKIFVIADMDIRIRRRYAELTEAGIFISPEEIKNNLTKRDYEETTRADSPLMRAKDAIILDNSNMTQEDQLQWALEKVNLVLSVTHFSN